MVNKVKIKVGNNKSFKIEFKSKNILSYNK